jgi:hypothetical protein
MTEGHSKTFDVACHTFGCFFGNMEEATRTAYASSDQLMRGAMILKTLSDRWCIDEPFHEVKTTWGAGQQ